MTWKAASVGGPFTLRKPQCAYGLIAQLVQRSALTERAPTTSPQESGRGPFYFGPPQIIKPPARPPRL